MKKFVLITLSLVLFGLIDRGVAQTRGITNVSVLGTQFCNGDPLSITFTVTGYWGHTNAFTVQLSDDSGSFAAGWTNLTALKDTLPGKFTIIATMPIVTYSTKFRLRIVGAIPYVVSQDNGVNITIGGVEHHPSDKYGFYVASQPFRFDPPYRFKDPYGPNVDSIVWDFGEGANTRTAVDRTGRPFDVTYAFGGVKQILVHAFAFGGCSTIDTLILPIFDCTPIPIPKDAIVIDHDTTLVLMASPGRAYWVNPGVKWVKKDPQYIDTIYAEPGATVSDAALAIVYLMPGSSDLMLDDHGTGTHSLVIHAPGASYPSQNEPTLECSNLAFDYSHAPPNVAFPASVALSPNRPPIGLSPNPTRSIVKADALPSDLIGITIVNVLGQTMIEMSHVHGSTAELDLSKLTAGTYYARFATPSAVVTKKIVKE